MQQGDGAAHFLDECRRARLAERPAVDEQVEQLAWLGLGLELGLGLGLGLGL